MVLTRLAKVSNVDSKIAMADSSVKKSWCLLAVADHSTYCITPPTGYQLSASAHMIFKPRRRAWSRTKSIPSRTSSFQTPGDTCAACPRVMVCAHMRTTLSPARTASFITRTMCSRPGKGRWRNGGGASEAASRTSHWFHPANTNRSPPSVNWPPLVRTKSSRGLHVVAVVWSSKGLS